MEALFLFFTYDSAQNPPISTRFLAMRIKCRYLGAAKRRWNPQEWLSRNDYAAPGTLFKLAL